MLKKKIHNVLNIKTLLRQNPIWY